MTGEGLLKDTLEEMKKINPSDNIIILYLDTMKAFQEFDVTDSFFQIKKNDAGEGLAWEIMFFNRREVIDLVVSRSSIDCTTILVKNIIGVTLQLNYAQNVNEKNEPIKVDSMTLSILNTGESNSLYYSTDTSKHSDFIRLRGNLLSLIKE